MPILANVIQDAFSPLISVFEEIMVFIHAHVVGGSWGLAIVGLTVLIRAIGPGLTQYGISGVMPDPQLMIYNSADSVIASNVGWGGDPQLTTVMNAVGSQPNPPASADSVALLTLAPGSYTAVAQSASGTAGDVLVDIYEVP